MSGHTRCTRDLYRSTIFYVGSYRQAQLLERIMREISTVMRGWFYHIVTQPRTTQVSSGNKSLLERTCSLLRTRRLYKWRRSSQQRGIHRRARCLPCVHLSFGVKASRTIEWGLEHRRSKTNVLFYWRQGDLLLPARRTKETYGNARFSSNSDKDSWARPDTGNNTKVNTTEGVVCTNIT